MRFSQCINLWKHVTDCKLEMKKKSIQGGKIHKRGINRPFSSKMSPKNRQMHYGH
jgi:hypothetical protein